MEDRDGIMSRKCTYRLPVAMSKICYLQLEVNGRRSVTVATFHRRSILTGRRAALEVDSSVLHILDLIVITWIFVEKTRRDQEQSLAIAAAA